MQFTLKVARSICKLPSVFVSAFCYKSNFLDFFIIFVFSGGVFFILMCVLHRRIQCDTYVVLKEILLRCLTPQCHRLFS